MKRIEEDDGFVLRYSKKAVKKAFVDVVVSAKKRGELVCGVYEAAQVLRRGGAQNVQFCVLVKSEDPANQVFCRLIEAYCCENRIKVIKVDCGLTLTLMVEESFDEIHHCVLVQKPTELLEEQSCLAQQTLASYMKQRETQSVLKIS
ncbi:growth arrest and DNA damage-inducible protein GADD45 alpha-like [Dendronephthya gigantea]|uniref:growth arrest and DNA damage-inducible protein GADD45 alpha-like n=1 Tax=Dendronephthya gigantea TaxID=151771 RepID=UPI00106B4008|nr:growth arrest and DNA damage-inducible protein GADD45 alpha-like [Dendronephthya gigantea]